MADSYTTRLRLTEQEVGGNNTTWGGIINQQITRLLDEAVAGLSSISLAGGDTTLTTANGAPDEARKAVLEFYGATADTTVTLPSAEKVYVVRVPQTTYKVTLTAGGAKDLDVLPETAVIVHVSSTGDVQAVTVPATLGDAGGGTALTGPFSTPAFADTGDLTSKLLKVGDNGIELNPDQTDKALIFKSKEGLELLHVKADDTSGANVSDIAIGNPSTPTRVLSTLSIAPASKAAVIQTGGQDGTLTLQATDAGNDGSAFAIWGDTNDTNASKRGYVEAIGTAGALSPKFLFTGFSGGLEVDGQQIWHGGNDGNGSGLDADLLAGHDHGDYLRLTKTSEQVAQGQVEFSARIDCKGSPTAIRLRDTAPSMQLYQVDGGDNVTAQYRIRVRNDDFEITHGSGDSGGLVLDKTDDALYRGSKSNNDQFISTKGSHIQEDKGGKGSLKVLGLYIQYGSVNNIPAGSYTSVTFATTFPTAVRSIVLGEKGTNGADPNFTWEPIDNTQFRLWNHSGATRDCSWMAMGD